MANGKWQMANGKWQMANGKWQMANGKWQMGLSIGSTSNRWTLTASFAGALNKAAVMATMTG